MAQHKTLSGRLRDEEDEGISKGSYLQTSFHSLHDMNHRARGLNSSAEFERPAPVSQISRISLPQARLNDQVKFGNWEQLEDFNLEELRDGFFDAQFTKPNRVVVDEDDDYNGKTGNLLSSVSGGKPFHCLKISERLWADFKKNIVPIFKFFTAYFVALVICVTHRSGNWVGHRYRYFLPIAMLIHHPVRTVGVQLEMFLMSVVGGVLAMGWSALAWYISVVKKPTKLHPGGILFASLTLALIFSTWLKELYQRTLYLTLTFNIAAIFLHDVSLRHSENDLQWMVFWDFGISYLFGMILSMVVCIVISPHAGNSDLIDQLISSAASIKELLGSFTDQDVDVDNVKRGHLQKAMAESFNVQLSEQYRDFANQWTFSRFSTDRLVNFRNSLTKLATPLQILPLNNKLLEGIDLKTFYENLKQQKMAKQDEIKESKNMTETSTPMPFPGTPSSISQKYPPSSSEGSLLNQFNIEVLRSTFSKRIILLIFEMIQTLENMTSVLTTFKKLSISAEKKAEALHLLELSHRHLKKRLYRLDLTYKNFVKSDFFSQELLADSDSVDIFLFLRYLRNAANHMLEVVNRCSELGEATHWRICRPCYPLSRALVRLPIQCAYDEGSQGMLHYFETERDVDEAFEKLYNAYTSRHKYTRNKGDVAPRAIDHNDFNFHTTQNPWRFKLWKFSSMLVGREMKWTIKVFLIVVFLSLPGWIPASYHWYQRYQCFWGPLVFYIMANRRYSGSWTSASSRLACGLIGIFWGWAANQSRHFGSPYVVCTFGGLLVIPCAFNYLVFKNSKSSLVALICFSVIALEPYAKDTSSLTTAKIWKNTWVTGLSFIIGIAASILVNQVVWSFKARSELRLSMSSLLAHIGQSYQSVTDRYLYRDCNDAPTEYTLAFSHIREVRLAQSLKAIKDLSLEAKTEPSLISNFSFPKYKRLLDVCEFIFQKTIEARVSSSFFEVWDEELDNEATRALLSLRRDSVSSVIFIFYLLSNCFRSKNKLPKYLPNPVLSRKKLYDFISRFEMQKKRRMQDLYSSRPHPNKNSSVEKKLKEQDEVNVKDHERLHWTEVHGMAFARAFTDITEAMSTLTNCAKEILG